MIDFLVRFPLSCATVVIAVTTGVLGLFFAMFTVHNEIIPWILIYLLVPGLMLIEYLDFVREVAFWPVFISIQLVYSAFLVQVLAYFFMHKGPGGGSGK